MKKDIDIDPATKQNLKRSIYDGVAFSVMSGISENFFSPFAIFCGLSSKQIGSIMSLPHLTGNTIQLFISKYIAGRHNRKNYIAWLAFLQGLALITFILLLFNDIKPTFYHILGTLIFYYVSGSLIGPIWSSFIGDVVPENIRGRFFGDRNRVCGIIMFISILAGGSILYLSRKYRIEYYGFILIFCIGFIARCVSTVFLILSYDPEKEHLKASEKKTQKSILIFFKDSRYKYFVNFLFFISLINFCLHFSGPYFAVYMLKELKLNYLQFTLISMTSILTQFLTMKWWGKLSDHFGNYRFIVFCAFGIVISPLLWLVGNSTLYLLAIQCYSGFVWAGFLLCSVNYVFDALDHDDRPTGFPLYHFFGGFGIFIGATAGGFAAQYFEFHNNNYLVKLFGGYSFRPLFFISGMLRLTIIAMLYKKFRELKFKSPTSPLAMFYRFSKLRPILGGAVDLISVYWKHKARK